MLYMKSDSRYHHQPTSMLALLQSQFLWYESASSGKLS